jgi:uncharacterized protein YozE (UPF0346 family)
MLATEILWAFENSAFRNPFCITDKFIEENADYKINMKIIANKYHELIDSVQNASDEPN